MKNLLSSLKFLFFRFSAFLFDMIILSLLISITLTVVLDVLGMKVRALDVIYTLSVSDSVFKSFFYLFIIGMYYNMHLALGRSTFGLWVAHQDYAEKTSVVAQEDAQDLAMVENIKNNKIKKFFIRFGKSFMYSSFQMINVGLLGMFTIYASFTEKKIPYHEKTSGIHIKPRRKK